MTALTFGNVHGVYKPGNVKLRPEILKECQAAIVATHVDGLLDADPQARVIVLGDLNSDWFGNDSIVTELAQRCGMQVYQPLADDLGTYLSNGRRLDWVLISDDLMFLHHEVLLHMVSDHHAVLADIGLKAVSADAPARARTVPRCAG